MKYLSLLFFSLLLFSCSKNIVCDCAKAGENLNKYANRFLTEIPSQANKDSIALLKKERESVCAEVKTLSTEKLEELSADCDVLQVRQ